MGAEAETECCLKLKEPGLGTVTTSPTDTLPTFSKICIFFFLYQDNTYGQFVQYKRTH